MNEVRQAFGRYGYAALVFLHGAVFAIGLMYLAIPWSDEYFFAFGYITVAGYVVNYIWYFGNRAEEGVSYPTTVLISGTSFGLSMLLSNFIFALQ